MKVKRKHIRYGYREADLTIEPGRFVYDFGSEFQIVGGEEYVGYDYKYLVSELVDGTTKIIKINLEEKKKLLIYILSSY